METLNLGTVANDGLGDNLRAAMGKIKANFEELLNVSVIPDAVFDGSADDTAAVIDAVATGKPVYIPPQAQVKITSDVEITTDHQRVWGPGVWKPVGNCGLVLTGGCVGASLDVRVNSSGHTGTAITVDDAHRVNLAANLMDCYDALYVTGANKVTVDNLWATCRHKGITWYGTTAVRSDLLIIHEAIMSIGAGQYGLDWDGNCHSLEVGLLGLICGSSRSSGNAYGVIVRNTSGGTDPAIGRFNHLEVDYSGTHGADIQAGSDIDFNSSYILGSTGSGLRVGATINDREVRFGGGKSRGNTRYGIEALGGVVLLDGSPDLQANDLGKTTGSVWTESDRFAVDNTAYFAMSGSNPVLVFDTNDYIGFNRSTNTFTFYIGGVAVWSVDATRITNGVRMRLLPSTVAALPGVHLAGDSMFATNARKPAEGAGSGTGMPVTSDGTQFRSDADGTTAAA